MPHAARDFESQSPLVREYESFLIRERGLAATTRVRYLAEVRRFISHGSEQCSTSQVVIGAEQVSEFLIGEARRVSTHTLQMTAAALRSFLRFLLRQGLIATDLASYVPSARSWSLATLPRYFSSDQVERLLES
jgi:integrase/recombinase XerD